MTRNRKGRAGWYLATLKIPKHTSNSTDFSARFKAAIATRALWGLLPVTVADWLIQWGGLRND